MTGAVVIGAIMPHGDLAIAQACDAATRNLAVRTQEAMGEAARRISASGAETVVLCTPHGVHVGGHMAVVTASRARGVLDDAAVPLSVACDVDRDLAVGVGAALRAASIPAVEVSYGGNDPTEAVMPLDWGAAIPLWHILAEAPRLRAVIVSPARDLDADAHVRAGAALAAAARTCDRRIAVVASADQGHGHSPAGPYGFRDQSAVFDARVAAMVRDGRLDELLSIDHAEVEDAIADSWWQMLMLLGALRADVPNYTSELLAYEAPTYYGMLTAVVTPRVAPLRPAGPMPA